MLFDWFYLGGIAVRFDCAHQLIQSIVNYNDSEACVWRAITIVVKMSGAFNRGQNYEDARYELRSIANQFDHEYIRGRIGYSEIIYDGLAISKF